MNGSLQQILNDLHLGLNAIYGAQLEKVVLYGSYVRVKAWPESDIDILIVLRGEVRYGEEIRRVVPLTADLSLQNNILISCAFTSSKDYATSENSLLANVRREGKEV